LRLGDRKLRDLANLWSYQLIITYKTSKISIMMAFWWRHHITSPKWRHKNFPFSSPPPSLAKSWLRPWMQVIKVV